MMEVNFGNLYMNNCRVCFDPPAINYMDNKLPKRLQYAITHYYDLYQNIGEFKKTKVDVPGYVETGSTELWIHGNNWNPPAFNFPKNIVHPRINNSDKFSGFISYSNWASNFMNMFSDCPNFGAPFGVPHAVNPEGEDIIYHYTPFIPHYVDKSFDEWFYAEKTYNKRTADYDITFSRKFEGYNCAYMFANCNFSKKGTRPVLYLNDSDYDAIGAESHWDGIANMYPLCDELGEFTTEAAFISTESMFKNCNFNNVFPDFNLYMTNCCNMFRDTTWCDENHINFDIVVLHDASNMFRYAKSFNRSGIARNTMFVNSNAGFLGNCTNMFADTNILFDLDSKWNIYNCSVQMFSNSRFFDANDVRIEGNANNCYEMFYSCIRMSSTNVYIGSNVINTRSMFRQDYSFNGNVNIEQSMSLLYDSAFMFSGCSNFDPYISDDNYGLTGTTNLLPDSVVNATWMFYSANMSKWSNAVANDVFRLGQDAKLLPDSLQDASYMFAESNVSFYNASLQSSPPNRFILDMGNARNYSGMFRGTANYGAMGITFKFNTELEDIDCSHMFELSAIRQFYIQDIPNIKNAHSMFDHSQIVSFMIANRSSFPLDMDASHMFSDCYLLTSIPHPALLFISNKSYMFSHCTSLVTDIIAGGPVILGGDCTNMFRGCTALRGAPFTLVGGDVSFMFSELSPQANITMYITAPVSNVYGLFNRYSAVYSQEFIHARIFAKSEADVGAFFLGGHVPSEHETVTINAPNSPVCKDITWSYADTTYGKAAINNAYHITIYYEWDGETHYDN